MYVGTLFKVDISKKYDGKITRLFNIDKITSVQKNSIMGNENIERRKIVPKVVHSPHKLS